MSYAAEISRANPSCFLFAIDQSGSMADPYGGESGKKKAEHLADAVNKLLSNLVIKCAKAEGVRDYFHIGVIGYGAQVGPAFTGPLAGKELVPISEVAASPARVEERAKKIDDGAGGLVEQKIKFPVWFDPTANNGTPMRQALSIAQGILRKFLAQHPNCFPPVVIHLTDGESTDGDPTDAMKEIASLASNDGNVLLFNFHLSSSPAKPIAFPHIADGLPDQFATMLFDNSSELTPMMKDIAKEQGFDVQLGGRGFIFNSDSTLVVQALDIGTRVSNLR